MKIAKFILYN